MSVETGERARRIIILPLALIVLLAGQILLVTAMMAATGIALPVRLFAAPLGNTFLLILLKLGAGVAGWLLIGGVRRTWRDYAAALRSWTWWMVSVELAIASTLLMNFYTTLKLFIPVLTSRNYDAQLWAIDRALLGGFSPNVLFLNLFSNGLFLELVDLSYAWVFFVTLSIATPLFLAHRSNRLRVGYLTGSVLLWSAGVWLYYAVPSLGPCYRFFEVWDPVRQHFPVSSYWQKALIENLQRVIRLAEGADPSGLVWQHGVAAFPSLHVGFQFHLALWLRRLNPVMGRFGFALTAIIFTGSILTGWHYLIDSIAGLILALVCYAGAVHLAGWFVAPRPALGAVAVDRESEAVTGERR
ncbi:MAG TPA: phosphatase PAP2 family protein [Thermoanaerobaculia bacterium]|nr:phosphatase PAP2 family protein [Thermoanaerobaculia bacterium]